MKIIVSFFIAVSFFLSVASADSDIAIYELPAFYNFQKNVPKDSDSKRRLTINPVNVPLSDYKGLVSLESDTRIRVTALKGETVYKGFLLQNNSTSTALSVAMGFPADNAGFNEANTEVSLVSTWFQAGKYTLFSKKHQYLTHELLLKTDVNVVFDDQWILKGSKWYYDAPEVLRTESIFTQIVKDDSRRILLEINVPENIAAGTYQMDLEVTDESSELDALRVGFDIEVVDLSLKTQLKDNYKLHIYTMLALDPKVGRVNTYINGQNNNGPISYQEKIYRKSIEDIADKGFNGIIITDWRPKFVDIALATIKDVGLSDVIIYGKSPIEKGKKVVSHGLIDKITSHDFTPIFYGYDEPGGNKKLREQLEFNKEINDFKAKSMNAVFWDDFPHVNAAIKDASEQFDYLTISMGSHGSKVFLNSLPWEKEKSSVKYLAYWHPHVENPIRNKLFMGYWLWASGLDGVSPHAYSIKPHVSKAGISTRVFDNVDDDIRGRLSPYNDFSMWDNAKSPFRQHATVYPEKNGVISTLQWEAIADGVTDLILVNQLEMLIATRGDTPQRERSLSLLSKIKKSAQVRNTSAISDVDTNKYMLLMSSWKSEIKKLIIEYGA